MGNKANNTTIKEDSFNAVVDAVELDNIVLTSVEAKSDVPPGKRVLKFESRCLNWRYTRKLLLCELAFAVKGTNAESENLFLNVSANYLVVYRVDSSEELDPQALAHFANINAPYNAIPYFREFIDNLSWRMGHESLNLPLMKTSKAGNKKAGKALDPNASIKIED